MGMWILHNEHTCGNTMGMWILHDGCTCGFWTIGRPKKTCPLCLVMGLKRGRKGHMKTIVYVGMCLQQLFHVSCTSVGVVKPKFAGWFSTVLQQQGLFWVFLGYSMAAFGGFGWEKDTTCLRQIGVVGVLGWPIVHNGYSVPLAHFARRYALQRHMRLKMTSFTRRRPAGTTHQELHQNIFRVIIA